MDTEKTTIAKFLLRRLKEIGVDHLFGVPGDFVLGFMNELLNSPINYIGTCNELNAAYAADGYARIKGIGCLATTYSVGELSAINGVAGAFAENIPVVKIGGVPATKFYRSHTLLHHTFGDYEAPYKMYAHVTVARTLLNEPASAASEIDRVLFACLQYRQPVYIGLPSDMVFQEIQAPKSCFKMPAEEVSESGALQEALNEAASLINRSRLPVLIPGIELVRRNLSKDFENLLNHTNIPYTTMMLTKGILDEEDSRFLGLYSGDRSRPYVRDRVERADCVVILGEKLTDFNTGGFTAMFQKDTSIEVYHNFVRIKNHVYQDVYIHDFVRHLTEKLTPKDPKHLQLVPAAEGCVHRCTSKFTVDENKRLTLHRVFDHLAQYMEPNSVLIAETGVSLFAAAETMLPRKATFISQTFYGSIGFSVGATLGVCAAAPDRKVYLAIGDGSFQVTCQDLSTIIRNGYKPVICLINNDGYCIERVITDRSYNDIQPWKYSQLPTVFNGKPGSDCYTEGDLRNALKESCNSETMSFIEVHLDRWDCSDSLRRAGRAMAINNRLADD